MDILQITEQYVKKLMGSKLPTNRIFHNIQHTEGVVGAIKILCRELNVIDPARELLVLAGWFHDTGHISSFKNHELESQHIASDFLHQHNYPASKIEWVVRLIGATKIPQSPGNLLEEIMCDADLYHLSSPDYCVLQEKLRVELMLVSGNAFPLNKWRRMNLQFLKQHAYFTDFGQHVFAKRKALNLERYEGRWCVH